MILLRYTANLTAHLSAGIVKAHYSDIQDLVSQRIPIFIPDEKYERELFSSQYTRLFSEINKDGRFWRSMADIQRHLEAGHAVVASRDRLEQIQRANCNRSIDVFGDLNFKFFGTFHEKASKLED